jgi:hypothetical protein
MVSAPRAVLSDAGLRACKILVAVALVSAACGDDDRGDPNAPVDLWPIPASGRSVTPSADGTVGRAAPARVDAGTSRPPRVDDGADEDAGPPMAPDPALAQFDPDEVYIFGTLLQGACYRNAVAPVTDPNRALVGFGCYGDTDPAFVRPSDGRLIYSDRASRAVYAFHCDGCVYAGSGDPYPPDPTANDELISTPACPGPAAYFTSFTVTAASETLIKCGNAQWYDGDGTAIGAIVGAVAPKVGHGGTALAGQAVVELATGARAPIVGPDPFTVLASRAREDGYLVALRPDGAPDVPELWHVAFDGTATLRGTYPSAPPGQLVAIKSALDGSGRLVQFSRDASQPSRDTIIRRSVDGESEVVYDEANAPVVKLQSTSGLFTGP